MPSGPTIGPYTRDDIKAKFAELDTDHDGMLRFDDLKALLRAGNPDMTEKELRTLWKAVDHDGDNVIDFDEFVDYIFSTCYNKTKTDWAAARRTFDHFAGTGKRLSERDFVRMCRKCDLFDNEEFDVPDADILYKKVHGPHSSEMAMKFEDFKKLLKLVARKKHMPLSTCVAWVGMHAAETAAAGARRASH